MLFHFVLLSKLDYPLLKVTSFAQGFKIELPLFLHADPLLALKTWVPTIRFSLVEDKPFSNQFEVISISFTRLSVTGQKMAISNQSQGTYNYEWISLSFSESLSPHML